MIKTCEVCGKQFKCISVRKRACSTKCFNVLAKEREREKRLALENEICNTTLAGDELACL